MPEYPEITENDQKELDRFAALLRDNDMPLRELLDKHGWEYCGITKEEMKDA